MDEIATRLNDFFLSVALAFSLVMLGLSVLATVICAGAIIIGHGKVMDVAKDWFWRVASGLILSGSATMIIKGIQAKLASG